jgi:hypothetical protein
MPYALAIALRSAGRNRSYENGSQPQCEENPFHVYDVLNGKKLNQKIV